MSRDADTHPVIRIEGRLERLALAELRRALRKSRASPHLTLDISGITSLDDEAVRALARFQGAGLRLRGGSMYLNRRLQEFIP